MKLLIQILFILTAFSYIGLMYCLRFAPPENLLNQELRPRLIRSDWGRKIFLLKAVGDDRYLLAHPPHPLTISVAYSPLSPPNLKLKTWLTDMVRQTLNQPVTVDIHPDPTMPDGNAVSDPALTVMLDEGHRQETSVPTVHLYYLSASASTPTNSGQALSPTDMVIFQSAINVLSESETIRAMVEQSTIMHEWGHLLGLDHIAQDGCIMNERVEVYGNRRFQGSNLPTTYCPEELFQLKELLNN